MITRWRRRTLRPTEATTEEEIVSTSASKLEAAKFTFSPFSDFSKCFYSPYGRGCFDAGHYPCLVHGRTTLIELLGLAPNLINTLQNIRYVSLLLKPASLTGAIT